MSMGEEASTARWQVATTLKGITTTMREVRVKGDIDDDTGRRGGWESQTIMSRQNMPRPQSSNRRQPLLPTQASSGKSRLAEVPAGLCRRALKRKRTRQLVKKGLLPPRRHRYSCGYDETGIQIHQVVAVDGLSPELKSKQMEESEKEVMKLEKEMWERFYGTGFWRSPSQRESPQTVKQL
ncbi:uncharacterized protein LOC121264745 [Juglans microcarpa x Juglans regia]|uniref:uncharacterized protein LOC121264745 n=1 Tax=Juglans microcarpa x Juglans regia TaxID=2249226 RepID=UPI001B7EA3E3|nr:uncharacterized protein LOC121264745 [Juglans microcarpa x Juglans regia]